MAVAIGETFSQAILDVSPMATTFLHIAKTNFLPPQSKNN